jgi:hypothetical protein
VPNIEGHWTQSRLLRNDLIPDNDVANYARPLVDSERQGIVAMTSRRSYYLMDAPFRTGAVILKEATAIHLDLQPKILRSPQDVGYNDLFLRPNIRGDIEIESAVDVAADREAYLSVEDRRELGDERRGGISYFSSRESRI